MRGAHADRHTMLALQKRNREDAAYDGPSLMLRENREVYARLMFDRALLHKLRTPGPFSSGAPEIALFLEREHRNKFPNEDPGETPVTIDRAIAKLTELIDAYECARRR